ncbi:MAG: helix-turn-helix domain-containing protein [Actinobacteria bacterium]|nr:helix-turn-helix domain-containing protein [Actinomycetota bacterium]
MSTSPTESTWRIRIPDDLGRAIAGARRERGLSQAALAEELGFKRSYLSELETGGEATIALERSLRALRRLGAELTVTLPDADGKRQ